MGLDDVQL